MDYDQLRLKIQNSIKGNASREITGFLLQDVLLSIVDILGDDIIHMAAGSTSKATDSDKLGGYPASHYATATSVTSLENLLASMWALDEEGNLVTEKQVIVKNNAIIHGDTTSGGEGGDPSEIAGTVKAVKVGEEVYDDVSNGVLDMTEAFESLQGSADKHYEHVQSYASDIWTIDHNLNKNPSVTVVDSAGTVVYGEVNYPSKMRVVIQFMAAFSGRAYLN